MPKVETVQSALSAGDSRHAESEPFVEPVEQCVEESSGGPSEEAAGGSKPVVEVKIPANEQAPPTQRSNPPSPILSQAKERSDYSADITPLKPFMHKVVNVDHNLCPINPPVEQNPTTDIYIDACDSLTKVMQLQPSHDDGSSGIEDDGPPVSECIVAEIPKVQVSTKVEVSSPKRAPADKAGSKQSSPEFRMKTQVRDKLVSASTSKLYVHNFNDVVNTRPAPQDSSDSSISSEGKSSSGIYSSSSSISSESSIVVKEKDTKKSNIANDTSKRSTVELYAKSSQFDDSKCKLYTDEAFSGKAFRTEDVFSVTTSPCKEFSDAKLALLEKETREFRRRMQPLTGSKPDREVFTRPGTQLQLKRDMNGELKIYLSASESFDRPKTKTQLRPQKSFDYSHAAIGAKGRPLIIRTSYKKIVSAALVIQSTYRACLVRQKFQNKLSKIIMMQRFVRKHCLSHSYRKKMVLRYRVAHYVGRWWQSYKVRKSNIPMVCAITIIRAFANSRHIVKDYERLMSTCRYMQEKHPCNTLSLLDQTNKFLLDSPQANKWQVVTERIIARLRAIVLIQKVVRGVQSRKKHKAQYKAVQRAKVRSQFRLVAKTKAATTIQSLARGISVRMAFQKINEMIYESLFCSDSHIEICWEFDKASCIRKYCFLLKMSRRLEDSATVIQKTWNMSKCRTMYLKARSAVVCIQQYARRIAMRKAEHNAAIVVQTYARRFLARKRFLRKRSLMYKRKVQQSATAIQAAYRGYRALKTFILLQRRVEEYRLTKKMGYRPTRGHVRALANAFSEDDSSRGTSPADHEHYDSNDEKKTYHHLMLNRKVPRRDPVTNRTTFPLIRGQTRFSPSVYRVCKSFDGRDVYESGTMDRSRDMVSNPLRQYNMQLSGRSFDQHEAVRQSMETAVYASNLLRDSSFESVHSDKLRSSKQRNLDTIWRTNSPTDHLPRRKQYDDTHWIHHSHDSNDSADADIANIRNSSDDDASQTEYRSFDTDPYGRSQYPITFNGSFVDDRHHKGATSASFMTASLLSDSDVVDDVLASSELNVEKQQVEPDFYAGRVTRRFLSDKRRPVAMVNAAPKKETLTSSTVTSHVDEVDSSTSDDQFQDMQITRHVYEQGPATMVTRDSSFATATTMTTTGTMGTFTTTAGGSMTTSPNNVQITLAVPSWVMTLVDRVLQELGPNESWMKVVLGMTLLYYVVSAAFGLMNELVDAWIKVRGY
jgi:IQ calmodulin-binding motif